MRDYNLSFIDSCDLFNHVKETVEKYRFGINLEEFSKNIIDPIKLIFDAKIYNKSIEEIVEMEINRQVDKSNNNQIGYFQQNIFKYLYNKYSKKSNWRVQLKGFDIVNEVDNIYVEMKNKHNTMNSSSSANTYMKMQSQISNNNDSTCFLVEVIAKHSQDIVWETSLNDVKESHENIRRISIDKFYEMVTGQKDAFRQLFEVIPRVIDDVFIYINRDSRKSTVINELKMTDNNILKSICLLSFKNYEGFNSLDIRL